jgi:hypothetical protein
VLARGHHTADLHLGNGTVVETDELGRAIIEEAVNCFCSAYMTV